MIRYAMGWGKMETSLRPVGPISHFTQCQGKPSLPCTNSVPFHSIHNWQLGLQGEINLNSTRSQSDCQSASLLFSWRILISKWQRGKEGGGGGRNLKQEDTSGVGECVDILLTSDSTTITKSDYLRIIHPIEKYERNGIETPVPCPCLLSNLV